MSILTALFLQTRKPALINLLLILLGIALAFLMIPGSEGHGISVR